VVFASNAEIGGSNSNGGYEVFLLPLQGGAATPVTNKGASVNSVSPAMSDDTQRVAFASTGGFAGQNSEGAERAFLVQRAGPVTSVLSPGDTGTFGLGRIEMNSSGTRVVFDSDGNHTGANPDGGSEIFVHDFGPTGERITQITDDAAGSGEVDIDASGRRIVFSSRGDHVGENADGGREIFLAQCGPPPTPAQCSGLLVTVEIGRGEAPTPFADVIRGTTGNDTVAALGGKDWFCGRGGADSFNGGSGSDWANGGPGDDVLRGRSGDDTLRGGTGRDRLVGGKGPDTCVGGRGRDTGVGCSVRIGIP
jgi:Ca2+-binding RTX toxin-like protein